VIFHFACDFYVNYYRFDWRGKLRKDGNARARLLSRKRRLNRVFPRTDQIRPGLDNKKPVFIDKLFINKVFDLSVS